MVWSMRYEVWGMGCGDDMDFPKPQTTYLKPLNKRKQEYKVI